MQVIEKLFKLSKDRIYSVTLFSDKAVELEPSSLLDQTIDKFYPKLSGRYQASWLHFKDRIEKNAKDFDKFQTDFTMHLKYDSQPKMETISRLL